MYERKAKDSLLPLGTASTTTRYETRRRQTEDDRPGKTVEHLEKLENGINT